jgi:nitroimidazol reductase NimA-like FMN-containing flavoprotein (pyridoxamine 5'-phosphate oxidase superfamily)
MSLEDPVTELSPDECWEMLRSEQFGRLAFRLVDELHITPVNYAVAGETLLVRTAEGSKLLGAVLGAPVAFEVDRLDEVSARSVVVRGWPRVLPENEARRTEDLPPRSWVPSAKYNVVEIVPSAVTGRALELTRPRLPATPPT